MTDLFDGLLALLFSIILNMFVIAHVRKGFPGTEGRFLGRIYVWTLAVRHVLAIWLNANSGNYTSSFADAFWGDSSTYDFGGYLLSRQWAGDSFYQIAASGAASGWGFHYFVALLYFIFGRNVLLVQFVNAAIGSLSVVVIYSIARRLFGAESARWPALFMAFFPQMIFWSCALYKDSAILLCIALSMYAVFRLRERFSVPMLALFVLSSLSLMALRFYIFYMVAFATLGTFLFAQRRGLFGSLLTQITLVLVFAGALAFGVRRETFEQQNSYFDLEKLQAARADQAVQGRSAYGAQINVSTAEGAIAALPLGVVYLLFAPFPWAISGLRQVLTLPETLLWYALMPALLRGLRYTIRNRFAEALPILVFALILTAAYGIFQSNVGTAYRQRTQISMFFFVFMGVGIEHKRAAQKTRGRRLATQPAWQKG